MEYGQWNHAHVELVVLLPASAKPACSSICIPLFEVGQDAFKVLVKLSLDSLVVKPTLLPAIALGLLLA